MQITLFLSFIVLGAFLSIICWIIFGLKLLDDGLTRRSLTGIYLGLASMVLVDLIILLGYLLHINGELFRLLLTFMMGMQIAAGLSLLGYDNRRPKK